MGSRLVRFALIWWLTETTGSATVLATATTATVLPMIFLGPFAGVLVDRWPRKWVLIISDGSTAVFTAVLSLLFWLGVAQPWHVFLILFLRSVGDAFQTPAMSSTTPLMVPKSQLARVAGMNSTLQGILSFATPPLGALLLAALKVRGVLPLDIITAIMAVLPLFFVPVPSAPGKAQGRGARAVLRDLGEGLRYIWRWPGLRQMTTSSILWGLSMTPVFSFTPLLVTERFGGGALELGWLSSAFGIGMLAGGVILGATGGFKRRMATSVTGTWTMGLGRLLVALAPPDAIWLAIVGQALSGVGMAAHGSGIRAAQQAAVAPEVQGRYFAVNMSVATAVTPISLGIAGPLADAWGVRPFWFMAAAIAAVIGLIRRFTPGIYRLEDGSRPLETAAAPGTTSVE